jgi:hypothetical protein
MTIESCLTECDKLLQECKKLDELYKREQEKIKAHIIFLEWYYKQPLLKRIWWRISGKKVLPSL